MVKNGLLAVNGEIWDKTLVGAAVAGDFSHRGTSTASSSSTANCWKN